MTVLAEKLAARKDLVTKIGRLQDEIAVAMVYDEGETPEATAATADEANRAVVLGLSDLTNALDELQRLEDEIRAANTKTLVPFEGTMYSISEAIVLRDRLKTEYAARSVIAEAADEALSRKKNRYDFERRKKDDVRVLTVHAPKVLREQADAVARRLRLLDVEIQKVNWSTEV